MKTDAPGYGLGGGRSHANGVRTVALGPPRVARGVTSPSTSGSGMKRKPQLTRRDRHAQISPTRAACSRSLEDQLGRSGRTVRTEDHPRTAIYRVALMTDDQLAALREGDPQVHDKALDDELRLAAEFDQRLAAEGLTPNLLRSEFDDKPILTLFVCTVCRSLAIAEASRPWEIEDAMTASGLSERDVHALRRLLVDAWGHLGPRVDEFSREALIEMCGLIGRDYSRIAFRERTVALLGERGDLLREDLQSLNARLGENGELER